MPAFGSEEIAGIVEEGAFAPVPVYEFLRVAGEVVADGGAEQNVRQASLPQIVQMADANLEMFGKLPF